MGNKLRDKRESGVSIYGGFLELSGDLHQRG